MTLGCLAFPTVFPGEVLIDIRETNSNTDTHNWKTYLLFLLSGDQNVIGMHVNFHIDLKTIYPF